MSETILQQPASDKSPDMTPRADPMAMCPMAKMCGRIMEKPHSGSFLMLPGALLILLGVLVFIEPRQRSLQLYGTRDFCAGDAGRAGGSCLEQFKSAECNQPQNRIA